MKTVAIVLMAGGEEEYTLPEQGTVAELKHQISERTGRRIHQIKLIRDTTVLKDDYCLAAAEPKLSLVIRGGRLRKSELRAFRDNVLRPRVKNGEFSKGMIGEVNALMGVLQEQNEAPAGRELLKTIKCAKGLTALHLALYEGHVEVAEELLKYADGDFLSQKVGPGLTFLHAAAGHGGAAEVMREMLKIRGCDDDFLRQQAGSLSATALHIAAAFGGRASVAVLLQSYSGNRDDFIRIKDDMGNTALHCAVGAIGLAPVAGGRADLVAELLGKDVHSAGDLLRMENIFQETALHVAAEKLDDAEAMKKLLDYAGIDPVQDKAEAEVLRQLAVDAGNAEVAEMLSTSGQMRDRTSTPSSCMSAAIGFQKLLGGALPAEEDEADEFVYGDDGYPAA